ncbi:fibrous sheath CABYR-binding protein isoform X2 [Betta splendens]|uniref:Fibrous sheath CABYR-binding protein isoform X2 n=1 Tax=Betta splendens TaxID=158456 RepID=A0A6P7NN20_BETSP|nr:fibrous sheath CABYR-binding protein isoform X2 [Betta splendens]
MFCRRAWQRVGPLAWRSLNLPCRSAPVRHMSSGVPGGSSNMTYFILCGGGLTAAVIYAYKSVNGDTGRYEDRLPDTDASAKTAAPATEATPAEEAAPAAEVISEPVFVPAEPVPVAAAELVLESAPKEAADVASEVQVLEAAAEEAAPPVEGALEVAAAEAAPVAMETPAEAHAAESTAPVVDLLTAVKVLSGSTVEIAAASVGEKSLVNAVQQIQEDREALNSSEEVVKPEILEAPAESFAETAAAVDEEEAESAEAAADDELSDDEEVVAEEAPAPAPAEEAFTASPQAVDEVVEEAVEDPVLNPDAPPKEAFFVIEASPEDASPAEQVTIAAEAPPADGASGAQSSEEALGEEAPEAASTQAHVTQLAAASTASEPHVLSAAEPESDAPGHRAEHCHSCHSAPSAEEAAPPTDAGQEPISEGGVDTTHEVKEVASPVTKTSENMMVTSES